jgi:hypothetical protein
LNPAAAPPTFGPAKGDAMKTAFVTFAAALGVVLTGTLLPATANADCGVPAPASWQSQGGFESGSLRLASDFRSRDPIVGMWRVTFIAEGNVGPGLPPDGAVVDSAFVQWHSDGTEIMNSSRNPATQSFCLGVWQRVGPRQYKLNHFAISWDPAVPDHPLGPANIREDVTLSHDGKTFSGTFTIDQYDDSNHLLVHLTGQLRGRRITVDTPISSLS